MFHLYGLFIGVGVAAGIWIVQLHAKRFGKTPKIIDDALLWSMIPVIIGARAYHVITDWHLYADGPIVRIFEIWNGGLGFFGALIGGILGILFFVRMYGGGRTKPKDLINQTPTGTFFLLLDLLSFGAPLAQAIGRFGNYFNKELYGLPTELPWAIVIDGETYHPLFAYEAILNMMVFLFLNWLGWKKKLHIGKGQYACIYLALYGMIRFWLELLRTDTARWAGTLGVFSIAQWVALSITMTAILIFWLRRHADRGIEWEFKTLL
jgi:phosphatidylglycerol---prolipoprotein diacylglyceryl transferase